MKTHLKDSSEPITEGRTQVAICGTEVKDAAFVLAWDGEDDRRIQFIKAPGLCSKCRKAQLNGRYVYVLTDGQNAKSGEREAAV